MRQKRWRHESARHAGCGNDIMTSKLPTKDVHPSILNAPDHVQIYPHFSSIGGETTSTQSSKFYSSLYSDAVDWDPIVKRFSDTVKHREHRNLVQGHIVSSVTNKIDQLLEVVSVFEAPIIFKTTTLFVLAKNLSIRLKEET
jgi:hypothetical protein